jgi:hypothetical protein
MLSGNWVWLAALQIGRLVVRPDDEAPRPRKHGLKPAGYPHFTSCFAKLAAMADANRDSGKVLDERALIVFAEQGGPGDEPVPRDLHREWVPAQPADALANLHVGTVGQFG